MNDEVREYYDVELRNPKSPHLGYRRWREGSGFIDKKEEAERLRDYFNNFYSEEEYGDGYSEWRVVHVVRTVVE